jgi:hypothetical protein
MFYHLKETLKPIILFKWQIFDINYEKAGFLKAKLKTKASVQVTSAAQSLTHLWVLQQVNKNVRWQM